jgi:hypothetical protein
MSSVWFTPCFYHAGAVHLNRRFVLLSSPSHGRNAAGRFGGPSVPSLFRFLFVVGLLAALGWGAMYALATFVDPEPREMTQTVPAAKFNGK